MSWFGNGSAMRSGIDIAANPTRTRRNFWLILAVFALTDLVSWPLLFSMNLWVFEDRGSFLNLDYLISQHLRLGLDVYYAYGLLPVAIQHWLFAVFGRGYWPLIGCAIVTMVLMAWFWALLLRYFPQQSIWIITLLATIHIVHWVVPNFPYSLVQLSLMFAVLAVMAGRLDVALAIAALGAWSVPSMPLVLMALIFFAIVLAWLLDPNRTIAKLARTLAPGILTYAGVGILLAIEFGLPSVLATMTPLAGMRFYSKMHYGSTGSSLIEFLHPPYHTAKYYLIYTFSTPVAWWVLSVLSLTVFGLIALRRMLISRTLDNLDLAIVLCAIVHGVFVAVAYGAPHQHFIYDPFLILGTLLGVMAIPKGRFRQAYLVAYICLVIAGQATFIRSTLSSWKEVRSPALTANLYAPADWIAEWKQIVDLSKHQNLFLVSYSTGIHDYFPTVHSADAWFLNPGQLSEADRNRLMLQLRSSDVIAIDLSTTTSLIDNDAEIRQYIQSLCLRQSTKYFQVWWRNSPTGQPCLADSQRVQQDYGNLQ